MDSVEIIKKFPRTDSIHIHSWQPRDVSPSHASSDPRVFDLEMLKLRGEILQLNGTAMENP